MSAGRASRWQRLDWPLVGFAVALLACSLPTIYSASLAAEGGSDPWRFASRQLVWCLAAPLALVLAASLDYRWLTDLGRWLYLLSLLGLVAVLLVGREINGARAWFRWGPLALQPAEPAKIALLAVLGRWFSRPDVEGDSLRNLVVSAALIAGPCVLVMAQPDLGEALTFVVMWLAMWWWSGARWWQVLAVLAVGGLLFAAMWHFNVLADYQKNRVTVLLNPGVDPRGVGYNLHQSLTAIGAGGLTGRGWLQGTQTHLRFLPERHTDFIFAVLCEEWGLAGAVVVLGLYYGLFWRLWGVINASTDEFGRQLVVGCGAMLLFHVVLNIGMVLGLLPITGLPLSFFSYGGSNLLASFVLLGIVLNVGLGRRGPAI